MSKKIGRNDKCPCGSGLKYKKCCMNKPDDPDYYNIFNLPKIYKEARKQARFKECCYPDHSSCSEKIIEAHSIQNNKILNKIADNGILYMPCPKPDLKSFFMNKYGRKEATVFTGFCSFHDKMIFRPIEDYDFDANSQQIFLHIYRAFALEYHRKQESQRMDQFLFLKKPSLINSEIYLPEGKTANVLAISDLEKEKAIFDEAVINEKYDILSSIVWTFPGFSNFAATGMVEPQYDFEGKQIQNLLDINSNAGHIFVSVFPEGNNTYVIIAWQRQFDSLFLSIKRGLELLSDDDKKCFINNLIPEITENIVIKPSSWEGLPKKAKVDFFNTFLSIGHEEKSFFSMQFMLKPKAYDLFVL